MKSRLSFVVLFGLIGLLLVPVAATASETEGGAIELGALTLSPTKVDITQTAQQVTVVTHVRDGAAPVASVVVGLYSPERIEGRAAELELSEGEAQNGVYRGTITIPRYAIAGEWEAEVDMTDSLGHSRHLTPGELQEVGLPNTVQVEGASDTEAPQLKTLAIEPAEVDTTKSDAKVSVVARVTDNLSGLYEVAVGLNAPGHVQSAGVALERTEGTALDGIYRGTITIPAFVTGGEWSADVDLIDQLGNTRNLGAEALVEAGFPHRVEVISAADESAPKLASLAIEPGEVNVGEAAQNVTVTARIVDDVSGEVEANVGAWAPGNVESTGTTLERIEGDSRDGIYRGTFTIPFHAIEGEWSAAVEMYDRVGNFRYYGAEDLVATGLPHGIAVKDHAVEPEDKEPPLLEVLTVEPTEINTSGAGRSVRVVARASDPGSGIAEGYIGFRSPGGGVRNVGEFVAVGGAEAPTLYEAVVPFEQRSEAGCWLADVEFADHDGNKLLLGPEGLLERGLPYEVTVAAAPVPTVSLASSPNPSVRGQKVTFTAKVVPPSGGATPLGTIAFVEGGATLGVANLSKGIATFNITALGAGEHPIVAEYSGDSNYPATASGSIVQVVAKATTQMTLTSSLNPSPYGSSGTLKANIKAVAPGAGTPTGTVTFREGETVLGTVQLSVGNAGLSLKTLEPGTHQISATYSGDANDTASEAGPFSQTIVKASTGMTLVSSSNPAPFGSAATLTATVKAAPPGGGTPTGTVTFREGETVLATLPLSAGTARFPLKTTAPGTHAITATYSGSADYGPISATAEQTVVAATTETLLTSTKNPAPVGSSGTLKATVKALAPGGGTPTGTVAFREGETVLAIVPLSAGVATYPLKALAAGAHKVTAVYGGNADYLLSEAVIEQTITP